METKSLLYGLIGFFLGGLLVSIAAHTFDKSELQDTTSMSQMTANLRQKSGDEYDKAFLSSMIDHHQAAIDMARLSATRAKHDEVKQLSETIIAAQEGEISSMRQWNVKWQYDPTHSETH